MPKKYIRRLKKMLSTFGLSAEEARASLAIGQDVRRAPRQSSGSSYLEEEVRRTKALERSFDRRYRRIMARAS
jgi:hypothetical protein